MESRPMLSSDRHERFSPYPSSSSLVDIGKAKVYHNPCNANNCFGASFDGNNDAKAYIYWEIALIEQFTCFHVLDSRKVQIASSKFRFDALSWWSELVREKKIPHTWIDMKKIMREKYAPPSYAYELRSKLRRLNQDDKTVDDYYLEFQILTLRSGLDETEGRKMDRFYYGLNFEISYMIEYGQYDSIFCLLNLAREVERKLQRRSTTNESSPQGNDTKDCVAELNFPCDQRVELSSEFSAPCDIDDAPTILIAPPVPISFYNDRSAQINVKDNESCEEIDILSGETCDVDKFGLGCVELITHGVIDKDPPINSLCYITLDTPMYLSHAMDKVSELRISKSFTVHGYTIHLIGQHDVNNNILVHEICITCDNFPVLGEKKFLHMLNHFNMTSNICVHYLPNSCLHDCMNISALTCSKFQHLVVTNLGTINYYSPVLGWYNGEQCKPNTRHCFTYICKKTFCQFSCWNVIHDDCLTNYLMRFCYKTLIVQERRCIKMDDIYIYHAHTLSILSVSFQHKRRRGRLSFQEREDDMDMTMDTTITNLIIGVFNNNSNQASY
ncbi:hypothetical protein BRADI_1g43423v3 [Brachypodium distachyon]|uniref:Retrotransposon gag domain-containing protein n=1 Tax=Brachypodium distachyon TaxID=15368 RepID=A0A2K2DP41_BRADI|nr:hypothetical protein BRADI_1g43423v3 [Brachypodium distachyon]